MVCSLVNSMVIDEFYNRTTSLESEKLAYITFGQA